MSMELDVGKGERKGCGSWLRSELMHYSKGARYVHCTCIAPWGQVGFVSTAWLIILLCLYMFVRDLYLN